MDNWLLKTFQQDYLHNEPDHDYDVNWDYEVDEQIEDEIKKVIDFIVKDIQDKLLPQLKIFRGFTVQPVNALPVENLAQYVNGTYSHPVIVIDLSNVQRACNEYGTDCGVAIDTTILHELGHAIQESRGKPFDEEEAEEFALQWHYYRKVLPI